jgi:hypothetical protein
MIKVGQTYFTFKVPKWFRLKNYIPFVLVSTILTILKPYIFSLKYTFIWQQLVTQP